ncbi:MAG: glycosyltransferase family 4 protein [Polyangiales bacterium]
MNEVRRVLHVLSGAAGGAAVSTIDLIDELGRLGVRSSAVCASFGTPEEVARLADAVGGRLVVVDLFWWNKKLRARRWKRPLIAARDLGRSGWLSKSSRAVSRFAADQGVDLIHSNTLVVTEGALASRHLGVPHAWHVREMVGPGAPFRFPFESLSLPTFLRWGADVVVANSSATAARLPSTTRPIVIPNGVAITPRRERAHHSGEVVVGMVANLTSTLKKHRLALEAFALLAPRAPQARLHLIGHDDPTKPYSAGLRTLARELGIADKVRFRGFVAPPEAAMSELDILLNPSDSESFGRVLIEAMASEIPVVSVRAGGALDIVEDEATGLFTRPDDATELANALLRLVSSPGLRRELGGRARIRVATHFSLAAHAERVRGAYALAQQRHHARRSRTTLFGPRPNA